jgi:hypothetical protein
MNARVTAGPANRSALEPGTLRCIAPQTMCMCCCRAMGGVMVDGRAMGRESAGQRQGNGGMAVAMAWQWQGGGRATRPSPSHCPAIARTSHRKRSTNAGHGAGRAMVGQWQAGQWLVAGWSGNGAGKCEYPTKCPAIARPLPGRCPTITRPDHSTDRHIPAHPPHQV